MLTATDVHYLIGFLTLMSSPDSVEIVLGDLVYDKAVGARRDVDVTVRYRDSKATTSVFKGIEVKKFGRKMDTPQVEQLVGKFSDMPTVSQKAIVSASASRKVRFGRQAVTTSICSSFLIGPTQCLGSIT